MSASVRERALGDPRFEVARVHGSASVERGEVRDGDGDARGNASEQVRAQTAAAFAEDVDVSSLASSSPARCTVGRHASVATSALPSPTSCDKNGPPLREILEIF